MRFIPVRRYSGRNDAYGFEAAVFRDFLGKAQVPEMDGIECAAEYADWIGAAFHQIRVPACGCPKAGASDGR